MHGLAVGDLDGDGRDDLVTANVKGPKFPLSVTWFDGRTGRRRFIDRENAGNRPHYVTTGDIDRDGRIDVALGDGGGFAVYLNPGPNHLDGDWPREAVDKLKGGTNVTLADVDGDGDLDVIGSAGHGVGIWWYSNPEWNKRPIDSGLRDVHALDAADLDGDGDIDVAAGSYSAGIVKVYYNSGAGEFSAFGVDTRHGQQSYALKVVDVNGDNRPDLLVGGRESNNLIWYRQRTD